MRKLPQEFAFPLGLGSKRTATEVKPNGIFTPTTTNDTSPRAPCQDLDTINL